MIEAAKSSPGTEDVVLLTGGTGQVGAALIPRLLAQPGTRVLALVRARDDAHLGERRRELCSALPRVEDAERLELLRGDLAPEDLALSPRDRGRIDADVTSIVHSAASVRFDLPIDEARAENVGGTQKMLAIARRLAERGQLRRYDHVSTCYVAGNRRGRALEAECDQGQGFRNSYEQSKCEADGVVRAAFRDGLPGAIHRPSIIVGDSRTGATRAFNVLYWPLKIYARGWWRWFPGSPHARVDVVPVDFVADSMVALRADPRSLGRTFHIAAGDDAPTVEQLVARVRQTLHGPALRYLNPWVYRRVIRPLLWPLRLTARGRQIFRGGSVYMPYLEGNPVFDTAGMSELLGEAGRAPSSLDYFERVVKFAVERDFKVLPAGGGSA
jgi:long-chain acyl-CoA synthetase